MGSEAELRDKKNSGSLKSPRVFGFLFSLHPFLYPSVVGDDQGLACSSPAHLLTVSHRLCAVFLGCFIFPVHFFRFLPAI